MIPHEGGAEESRQCLRGPPGALAAGRGGRAAGEECRGEGRLGSWPEVVVMVVGSCEFKGRKLWCQVACPAGLA